MVLWLRCGSGGHPINHHEVRPRGRRQKGWETKLKYEEWLKRTLMMARKNNVIMFNYLNQLMFAEEVK